MEQQLSQLEKTSNKLNKNLERTFQVDITEVNNKNEKVMKGKLDEMKDLDGNLDVLTNFKDTKQIREDTLNKEFDRYGELKR